MMVILNLVKRNIILQQEKVENLIDFQEQRGAKDRIQPEN
jgi:Holliday junction resolvase